MLKTRKKTMVCIGLTHIVCRVWKYLRTCTPLRKIDDFDYTIAVLDTEEGSTLQLAFRTKLGITLDLMTTDGDTIYGIGYTWKVGN